MLRMLLCSNIKKIIENLFYNYKRLDYLDKKCIYSMRALSLTQVSHNLNILALNRSFKNIRLASYGIVYIT